MQTAFRYPLGFVGLLALAACVMPGVRQAEAVPSGAQDYADYCAACHGAGGKGDGAAAAGLTQQPADLTQLAAGNGGVFPGTRVMAQIWGYTGGRDGERVMPKFAALLESEVVPYDGGDGIATPTPLRLVQLAEYVKALQD